MTIAPWMLDLVLIGIAAEFALIAYLLVRSGYRPWAGPVLWFLISGALLMWAVRLALAGDGHPLIGAALALSLVTHLACLWTAWRLLRR